MTTQTFSYEPLHRGDLDRIRFHIGDTISGDGPLPDDGNLQDDEIVSILAVEGHWGRAVAACFERLSAAWRKYPNLDADQFGLSRSHISRGFAEDAAVWRKTYGYPGDPVREASNRAYSTGFIRVDAWSDDAVVGEADAL